MKSLSTNLIAALLIGSFGLAGVASAACNGGGNKGGRGGGYGNPNYNGNNQSCNSNGGGYYSNPNGSNYGQAYEPFHSTYFVQPGDNFYVVSLKEYGNSSAATSIARFNRMAPSDALRPGQRLVLPSISANGILSVSRAPAAESFSPTSNAVATSAKLSPSVAVVPEAAPTTDEVERPSVPTGSVIKLDGQSLGDEKGVVRLRISNVALPVEIVEWTADSTKVRLPKLDVNGAMKAELEVVRADGTVAATNPIELTSTVDNLALKN